MDMVFTIPPLGDDSVRNMAKDISKDEVYLDKLVYMAQGNPGALTALKAMHDESPDRTAWCLGALAAANVKGSMIWLVYKDLNRQNAADMLKMIEMEEVAEKLEALHYSGYKQPGKQ